MLENIKVYSSDKCWKSILSDLGVTLVDSPNLADVIFDDIDVDAPISVMDIKNILINRFDNNDIIRDVFGRDVVLSQLQHRIIVMLYKNPDITMPELKTMLGLMPGITSHTVENAVYQLRKNYGRDLIQNNNGKYKIGHV